MTGDGRWDYQWDGENRLTVMTTSTIAQTAGVPYQRLVFSYDGQGRRVRKQVFDSPTGAATDDLRFLYDGWNLLIEYRKTGSSAPAVLRSYLWGQDLAGIDSSGQPSQGAGGVGGLLGVTTGGNSYLPAYDGNGNIVAWLNSSNQLVCKQEYDPFGNRIIHEGSVDLPIGFSTKYRDEETNLLYYGYRYYDPATGRWPSRDPIEEAGGVNLYGMVGNDPVNKSDYLGLFYPGSWYSGFKYNYSSTPVDKGLWNSGKSLVAKPLTQVSMNHADGTTPGNWTLDVAEALIAKGEFESASKHDASGKPFMKWFENYLKINFNSKPDGTYRMSTPAYNFKADRTMDIYTAFGDARLKFEGNVCKISSSGKSIINFSLKVKLNDFYTFISTSNRALATSFSGIKSPTAIGYRLEDSGYLHPYDIDAEWEMIGSKSF